ncbi:MAG: tetratricopeptide repeat protein [Desulfovibrionaceae bacterium]
MKISKTLTRILLGGLTALLLPALALAQAPPVADLPDEPVSPQERQMALMEARILSRQGDLPKSLALYEQERREYPDDQEVYEDYLETLAGSGEYERLFYELERFRRTFGHTPRSERIEAGVYAALGRPQYGLDVLERAQRGNPSDMGIWSDIGFQRQAARDVNGAIQAFSEVLDHDPDNQAAREALHGLLLEQRPRSEVGFNYYDQGQGAATSTASLECSMPVGDDTRLFTEYDQVHVSRSGGGEHLDADIGVLGARLEHRPTRDLTLMAGIQPYIGLGDGLAPMAGLRYDLEDYGRVSANYAYHLPWYDEIQAAGLRGNQDRLRLEYELPFRQVWTAYAAYERENYRLGDDDFGSRWEATGSLSRRVWENPDVYLTYTFQRAEFSNDYGDGVPFEMIHRELSHTGTVTVVKELTDWLEASVSGGIKHDYERHVEALMLSPRLVYHPLARLRVSLGWDYSSESDSSLSGETNNYSAQIAWTW